ncbi:MAG: Fe-S cluster assembly ATP-binding protein [Candidatus Atribacteria bacterium]|nr:Fe-S cluster assembly ATP-binding protein [Candidatus Atribacteria bacterium]
MLCLDKLKVAVEDKVILKEINLTIAEGEIHVLLGPNGAGKTTLLMAIMGMPGVQVIGGGIYFQGRDITGLELEERAQLGIGMAFQKMPQIPGVTLRTLGELIIEKHGQDGSLAETAERINCTYLLDRNIGFGFSGGEAKRAELFQLLLQQPLFSMVDEPESGVDLDNIALVGSVLNDLFERKQVKSKKRAGLIITHTGHILDYLNADMGHVLMGGKIVCRGNPRDLLSDIQRSGYEHCLRCES